MRTVVAVAVVVVAAAACHPSPRRDRPDGADAAYRLDDADDRAEVRDELAALPADAAERTPLRARIAAAVAVDLDDALARHQLGRAQRYLDELASLWRDDPPALVVEGSALVPALVRARDAMSRAGSEDGALLALATLALADSTHADHWYGEIDEILAFTDDLAVAQSGADAVRARAIPALAPVVVALPSPAIVDRYVVLVAARQARVNELLAANGATIELVQAHHDVLDAAYQLAGALARAGRLDDLAARIPALTGLGAERPLAVAAQAIAGHPASGEPYRILAGRLREGRRDDDSSDDDPGAALAVCRAALAIRPRDPVLLACAGEHAASAGRRQLAIRLLEEDFADGAEDADAAETLARLYRDRIGQLGFAGRLGAARAARRRLQQFLDGVKGRVPTGAVLAWQRDGDVVLARALTSQGHLDEARAILAEVAAHAPTVEALEALATIDADRGHNERARAALEQAIELGGDRIADALVRGRLHRLAAEAARRAGDDAGAANHYVAALSIWASLSGDEERRIELPPAVNGLRLVESGRAMWAIGQPDKAVEILRAALEVDADGEDTYVQVVAFLVLNHRLADATEAFHRAVATDEIGDAGKIYMALWILGEARRAGEAEDAMVLDYLRGRQGTAWPDELARAATGRLAVAALAQTASSPTQRAELAFYTATLALGAPAPGRVRELLEEVVDSDLVLVFEREIARNRLSGP